MSTIRPTIRRNTTKKRKDYGTRIVKSASRNRRYRAGKVNSGVIVSYTGTQDFDHIADQLDSFVYEPSRSLEIKQKYEGLRKYGKG